MVEETVETRDAAEGILPDAAPEGLITGEVKPDEVADINLQGFKDVGGVPEGEALPDDTPQVQSLTAGYQPNKTTIISARFFDPANGWVNKQKAFAGKMTAQQLGIAVSNLLAW